MTSGFYFLDALICLLVTLYSGILIYLHICTYDCDYCSGFLVLGGGVLRLKSSFPLFDLNTVVDFKGCAVLIVDLDAVDFNSMEMSCFKGGVFYLSVKSDFLPHYCC